MIPMLEWGISVNDNYLQWSILQNRYAAMLCGTIAMAIALH
jgi:hypothetical protein